MKYGNRFWVGVLVLLLPITWIGCAGYISRDAKRAFEKRDGKFSVTVFPVSIVKGFTLIDQDREIADQLARFLNDEGIAEATVTDDAAIYEVVQSVSQPVVMENSAIAFAAIVKERQIATQYALLVEILFNRRETVVRGVHIYLVDSQGKVAMIGLNNSHWEEYKAVEPKDRQGGYQVAVRMLRRLCRLD